MTNIEDNPYNYFEKQRVKFTVSLGEIKHRIRLISLLRIIVFLITLIGIYLAVAYEQKGNCDYF